jgi:hypothetical protein
VGALLRREGLYSSHLTTWRAARERGELAGAAKNRGPAPVVTDARDKVIAEQARALAGWKHRAERAEALVEVPKKLVPIPKVSGEFHSEKTWGCEPWPCQGSE